jgi:diphthine-ammonia ligase
MNNNALVSWSGGKDSCFATMKAMDAGIKPKVLLNVLNEHGRISRSHGIPAAILYKQAKAMHLPIHLVSSSWADYETNFIAALQQLQKDYKLHHAVFGDIDLQAHRDWEEMVCQKSSLEARLPLWQQDRKSLVLQMLDEQLEAIIVSCNATMGEKFLGKKITRDLVQELEDMGIDTCGENGEYHTLVTNCKLFKKPLAIKVNATWQHNDYWFTTLGL